MELEGCRVASRYDVLQRLQSGYYGTTWLAKDREKDEDVCLKTFFAESPSQRKELGILRSLSKGHFRHDNLCRVLDVAVERAPVISHTGAVLCSLHYVVFEYCSGSDLFNFLVTGPFERTKKPSSFPEPLARHYLTQALLAVMYLHERGVFHRDIKPENCVLDSNFNLKLTDFGTNKILPLDEPGQVLRTATKGIGTDSYRAPEVNDHRGYDPSSADVWSLGVTLFFFVGIDVMVEWAQRLDQYERMVVAPLGILFPFPLLCTKLDSYMRTEAELRAAIERNGGNALSNSQFWLEWQSLHTRLTPQLVDLFNRMFLMEPSLRISLREIASHPWLSMGPRLSPDEITQHMQARCPRSVHPSLDASPRVVSQRLLGGVDQAALRQSLSRSGANLVTEYLTDSELWLYGDTLRNLESVQLDIVATDLHELMMDVNFCSQLLRDVLSTPLDPHTRTIPLQTIQGNWIVRFLHLLGFLPQGKTLFLPQDVMNLVLLQCGVALLEGLQTAVSRSAIPIATSPAEEEEDTGHMITDQSESFEGSVTFSLHSVFRRNPSGSAEQLSSFVPSSPIPLQKQSSVPFSFPPKPSSLPGNYQAMANVAMDTNSQGPFSTIGPSPLARSPTFTDPSQDDSQDSSAWTAYTTGTLSQQSSQEEFPEAMVEGEVGDFTDCHEVLQLATSVNTKEARQYRAAAEFCKLSGLLCSYGLYQVVCNEQLVLYCRGNTTSFSARVVALDRDGKIGVSSWCFGGPAEWKTILDRLAKDMQPQVVVVP